MVEHSAVNRVVAGSSPARGVDGLVVKRLRHRPFTAVTRVRIQLKPPWPGGQEVKTPPFHGGNTSSILVRVTIGT